MKISDLAARAGAPTSTVRYYERIGLLPGPRRTPSGYRDYDDDHAARLIFIMRSRHMGLSCDQIADVLPIWDGVNCGPTHERIATLVAAKRAEIEGRIEELRRFLGQLDEVARTLESAPPPAACLPDLSCCLPETAGSEPAPVTLGPTRRGAHATPTPT